MKMATLKDLVEAKESVSWLVEGLLPDEGWTLFTGPPGVGKSFFCLQLIAALQKGDLFLGKATKQVNCLYVQADTPTMMWKDQVKRVAAKGMSRTVYNVEKGFLDREKNVEILHALVWGKHPKAPGLKFDFVVFDSLNAITMLDINTKPSMKILYSMEKICSIKTEELDDSGEQGFRSVPFLVISHPTKGKARGVYASAGYHGFAGACANMWTLASNILCVEKCKILDKVHWELERSDNGLWYVEGFEPKEDLTYPELDMGLEVG